MWSEWWSELRRPGTLIGISAGIIIAFATWYLTRQNTELSFQISQIQVVNAVEGSVASAPFTVLDSAGKRIQTNIYAANIAIWNSGDVELGESKIRRPITITLDGNADILDQSISRIK